jgi:hypothetical protein
MPGAARHKSDVGWRSADANKFGVTVALFKTRVPFQVWDWHKGASTRSRRFRTAFHPVIRDGIVEN